MATQSVSEGCKTLLTVTVRYSSSARLDFRLTLILIEGSVALEHSINVLLFKSRKSEIAVWFLCMAMEFICKGCNDHDEEGEGSRRKVSNMMKNLKTQQEFLGSMRKLQNSLEYVRI
jgi:hypothetical protein